MACVLVLPALRGLLATATASASGLSPPSPEFFLLLIELVGKLLPLLITGLKQRQKGKVSPNHQDADGLQNELLWQITHPEKPLVRMETRYLGLGLGVRSQVQYWAVQKPPLCPWTYWDKFSLWISRNHIVTFTGEFFQLLPGTFELLSWALAPGDHFLLATMAGAAGSWQLSRAISPWKGPQQESGGNHHARVPRSHRDNPGTTSMAVSVLTDSSWG